MSCLKYCCLIDEPRSSSTIQSKSTYLCSIKTLTIRRVSVSRITKDSAQFNLSAKALPDTIPSTFLVVNTTQEYEKRLLLYRGVTITHGSIVRQRWFVNQISSVVIRSRFRRTNTSIWVSHLWCAMGHRKKCTSTREMFLDWNRMRSYCVCQCFLI